MFIHVVNKSHYAKHPRMVMERARDMNKNNIVDIICCEATELLVTRYRLSDVIS